MADIPGIGTEWLTTKQGAELTGYSVAYMRQLVHRGMVLARKVGRDWLLNRESLLAHKRKMDDLGEGKHSPWRDDLEGGRKPKSGKLIKFREVTSERIDERTITRIFPLTKSRFTSNTAPLIL